MERKTPLYERHVALDGKIVPFGGYLLPIRYGTGIISEHMAVRTGCGLFDVSHMGEVMLRGPGALQTIQRLLCNDFAGMKNGRVRYSPMCNEHGGIVDDLLVYKIHDECYMLVVNASNRGKDVRWIREHITADCGFEDISEGVALLALQGPKAGEMLQKAGCGKLPGGYYTFIEDGEAAGIRCFISRTGYTGEDGFEFYCSPTDAPGLWDALLDAGGGEVVPCGLGARDTLRLEAAMPLYGHELDEDITPYMAGLGNFVKPDKGDFIGREALLSKTNPARVRVGLRVTGRGIIRERCDVYAEGNRIGTTTSGTHCPFLGYPAAMAFADTAYADAGRRVETDVRGRRVEAEIVPLPFYHRTKQEGTK